VHKKDTQFQTMLRILQAIFRLAPSSTLRFRAPKCHISWTSGYRS